MYTYRSSCKNQNKEIGCHLCLSRHVRIVSGMEYRHPILVGVRYPVAEVDGAVCQIWKCINDDELRVFVVQDAMTVLHSRYYSNSNNTTILYGIKFLPMRGKACCLRMAGPMFNFLPLKTRLSACKISQMRVVQEYIVTQKDELHLHCITMNETIHTKYLFLDYFLCIFQRFKGDKSITPTNNNTIDP